MFFGIRFWCFLFFSPYIGISKSFGQSNASDPIVTENIIGNEKPSKPNVIIFLADDLGYGDLGTYGHPTSRTRNIDYLAENGRVLKQFYVTSPVCSPSRASLLTGRYQVRSGVYPGTFVPDSVLGLPEKEVTVAQLLKLKGYKTQIVGKWHLGVGFKKQFLPTNFGFDNFLGLPYSHDMCPCITCFPPNVNDSSCFDSCWSTRYVSCPLFRDRDIIEQPTYLPTLTGRYLEEALKFVSRANAEGKPFFLYFPFHHIHHPQFASKKFYGKSSRGRVGDALLEMDWVVGEIMEELNRLRIARETLVWLTSDNGPSLTRRERGGCAGPLRCGKGTTMEGGVRVPSIVYWPGTITPGKSFELSSTLDILPTLASLVGASTGGVTLDGVDITSLLVDPEAKSPRLFYAVYPTNPIRELGPFAVIFNQYKAHFYTQGSGLSDNSNYDPICPSTHRLTKRDPPLLYDLSVDPGERYDLGHKEEYIDVVSIITGWRDNHTKAMQWLPPRTGTTSPSAQPCCSRDSQELKSIEGSTSGDYMPKGVMRPRDTCSIELWWLAEAAGRNWEVDIFPSVPNDEIDLDIPAICTPFPSCCDCPQVPEV